MKDKVLFDGYISDAQYLLFHGYGFGHDLFDCLRDVLSFVNFFIVVDFDSFNWH